MLNKKIVRISFCFLICLAMLCSACPIAFASTQYFQVDFSRPQLSGNDFYIEVLMYNPSLNRYRVKVLYFVSSLLMTFTDNAYNNENLRISVELYPERIDLQAIELYGQQFAMTQTEIYDDGSFRYYNKQITGTGASVDAGDIANTDYGGGYSAVAYRLYGDVFSVVDHTSSSANTNFAIVYGETNSVNQSIAQVINAIAVLAQNDEAIKTKLQTIIESLNIVEQNSSEMLETLVDLFELSETVVEKLGNIESQMEHVVNILANLYSMLNQIEMWIQSIYYDVAINISPYISSIDQKLQTIIDILNSGQNQPTLKNPNESLDSAFGDVSDWFGGLDNFGNQLEANKAENQDNLNNAKLFLSGVFGVFPPQIIIALVFVALMILVAKVIGR